MQEIYHQFDNAPVTMQLKEKEGNSIASLLKANFSQSATAAGLPIGSGEIESSHRHVTSRLVDPVREQVRMDIVCFF